MLLLDIPGPAGRLEGMVETDPTAGPVRLGLIVCHPHPRYGGTMRNKVVHAIARGAQRSGAVVLRFNFRGVGRSAGQYDQGIGEQDDLRAALTWLGEQHPGLPLLAAGFSFGARVALAACCSDPRVERVLAVGLPAGSGDYRFLARCCRPKHFLHSTHDQYGSREQMEAVFRLAAEPKELIWIEAPDHFFQGALGQLEEAVSRVEFSWSVCWPGFAPGSARSPGAGPATRTAFGSPRSCSSKPGLSPSFLTTSVS
jgi:hypothetical protein